MTTSNLSQHPALATDTVAKLKSFRLWTLKELNLKEPKEADALGYLRIIKHSAQNTHFLSGKWVSPEDTPALYMVVEKNRNSPKQETRETNNQTSREEELKLATGLILHNQKLLTRIGAKIGKVLPPDAADCLLNAPSAFNMEMMTHRLYLYLKSTLSGEFETYWPKKLQLQKVQPHFLGRKRVRAKVSIFLPENVAKDWCVPTNLSLKMEDCCRIMIAGIDNAKAELEQIAKKQASDKMQKIQQRIAPFEKTRPAWFSYEEMLEWGEQQTPTPYQKDAHPAFSLIKRVGKLLKNAGIQKTNEEYYGAFVCAVSVGEKPEDLCHIKVTAIIDLFHIKLWKQASVNLTAAINDILAYESANWTQRAASLTEKYRNQTMWTPELSKMLLLSEQEWATLIGNTINATPLEKTEHFPVLLSLTVAERKREAQIFACSGAIPQNLADLYPVARSMKRKLTLIVGPTNSGKTYQAIERIKQSENSIYLGPLRLLALEVRDTLEEQGVPTSLVTGEYVEKRANARCSSCTVEMLDFERPVDIAVIDEVHMLGDPQRGSAWVQAIMGAPASEIWMLGAPEAEEAVKELAKYTGENLEVRYTERLAPFSVNKHSTPISQIPSQSAVIAFSRQAVLDLSSELQEKYGKKCAVIYGALSPEVRRGQAELFRTGAADIVVATDAIAMGLNLPIQNIYFSTDVKWNGKQEVPVPNDLVWQIAGRAGRFGFHEKGHVGAVDNKTLSSMSRTLAKRPKMVPVFYAHGPSWPLVKMVSEHFKTNNLARILSIFTDEVKLSQDKRFHFSIGEDQIALAKLVDKYPFDLRTKLTLSAAPVPGSKFGLPAEFIHFVKSAAHNKIVSLDDNPTITATYAKNNLENAESAVKLLTLYCWLHYRFETLFPDLDKAVLNIKELNVAISKHLEPKLSKRNTKKVQKWRRF